MIQSIFLKYPSKKLVFLIHGYTGGPTDFNGLPKYLSESFKADVKVFLMRGHGTRVEDLDDLSYEDFIEQADEELKQNFKIYDEIIIGGVSFGGQLSLILASKYPVKGVFTVCIPYKLKFPFNTPFLSILGLFKKLWLKKIPVDEMKLRQEAFYYKYMHKNGLIVAKKANRDLDQSLSNIKCPILTIHSRNDSLGNWKAVYKIDKKVTSPHLYKIYDAKNHNLFFCEKHHDIYIEIGDFINSLQNSPVSSIVEKPKVAAVVPAYNESANIERVLKVLIQTQMLDEIIVIDDGSTDNTVEIVSKFNQVKLFINSENRGKAYSMNLGVEKTTADIIFFCDADLHGLTPEIIENIINPVAKNKFAMFIGIRNNVMQKMVTLFAINSGERAIRREVWGYMAECFKYRYRVEAGLNFTVQKYFGGYGSKKFDYYQTLKEKKYGFWRGSFLRWWMNIDVGYAYLIAIVSGLRKKRQPETYKK